MRDRDLAPADSHVTPLPCHILCLPRVCRRPVMAVTICRFSGCSSVWLERVVWDHEVAGSNPVTPIRRSPPYSGSCAGEISARGVHLLRRFLSLAHCGDAPAPQGLLVAAMVRFMLAYDAALLSEPVSRKFGIDPTNAAYGRAIVLGAATPVSPVGKCAHSVSWT